METDLCHIEPREVFFEHISLDKEVQKISTAHVLQDLSDMKSK